MCNNVTPNANEFTFGKKESLCCFLLIEIFFVDFNELEKPNIPIW